MRIGIMGGTMDPIHNGHIAIAQMVKNALQLDDMLLLPAGDPPHKTPHVDKWRRLEMVRLAAEECGMLVSDSEVSRAKTTYTVDTLTEFTAARPDVEWVYVVGGDTVFVIEKWRNFPQVAKMCEFAVVSRPGDEKLQKQMDEVAARTGAKFTLVSGVGPDISSTMIREMAAAGQDVSALVPKKVAEAIARNGLYRPMDFDEMHARLSGMIPEKRLIHSIGVMETAVRLAPAVGVDVGKARIAGLLHDCAKKLTREQMLEACKKAGIALFDGEAESEPILHAPAGVHVARYEFGVTDREVLSAIRYHTAGAPDMSPLEELIFVADFIEPNRRPIPGLEAIREVAEKDIHEAARMCAESTKRHVTANGWPFCPQTQAMLDAYERK